MALAPANGTLLHNGATTTDSNISWPVMNRTSNIDAPTGPIETGTAVVSLTWDAGEEEPDEEGEEHPHSSVAIPPTGAPVGLIDLVADVAERDFTAASPKNTGGSAVSATIDACQFCHLLGQASVLLAMML